jgi:hypothetical protein
MTTDDKCETCSGAGRRATYECDDCRGSGSEAWARFYLYDDPMPAHGVMRGKDGKPIDLAAIFDGPFGSVLDVDLRGAGLTEVLTHDTSNDGGEHGHDDDDVAG